MTNSAIKQRSEVGNLLTHSVSGEFITFAGERFYAVYNADRLAPFFTSIVSDSDHWLFVSSTGGLSAGRESPETALFPYITVDKIHESYLHSGTKTILHVDVNGSRYAWEPFNREHDERFVVNRHLYKNSLGNKICFEEVNQDLQLVFRYTWMSSDHFGFVRQCELQNLGDQDVSVTMLDGLQDILPAGTPRFTQSNSSNLVDAYKWTELDEDSGVAFFTLYSGITDRAEPCESLKANTVFCLGLEGHQVLISSQQLDNFRRGNSVEQEAHKRGIRGAYFVHVALELTPQAVQQWKFVANVEQSQSQVVDLCKRLGEPVEINAAIVDSVNKGSDALARIMASGDGFQVTNEDVVTEHHYANVLYNILRGGVFDDQYRIGRHDLSATIKHFNRAVFSRNQTLLDGLPEELDFTALEQIIKNQGDLQLTRLCSEYLPITFGRRHGDPSRPWNQFSIKLKDEQGNRILSYQGNWRDIFQNWEALALSYPEFVENMIAKFVNASTVDGYNPYRITKQGIDWEVEELDDPWSYIGYWGDHQIIYLLKLLKLSNKFHPAKLSGLLRQSIFCYANVPYRIKPFDALLEDAKSTVEFDEDLAERIEQRLISIGADGKLVLDSNEQVYQVNLLEKLLVPLLSKLGNLVVDGGIWLNTQRPEWNDANNALVGQGLSMVTLYYLRPYISFLQRLLLTETEDIGLSVEVQQWLNDTALALSKLRFLLDEKPASAEQRLQSLSELGLAASRYRETVYRQETFSGIVAQPLDQVRMLLDDAQAVIDHSIRTNVREDGLYHAYNLLQLTQQRATVGSLYPMLEGQVAALSSGAIAPKQAVAVLEALFESEVYRADQQTFMLYPDRKLPSFLAKNVIPENLIKDIPLVNLMLEQGDEHIVLRDAQGSYRFNAGLTNAGDLTAQIRDLPSVYDDMTSAALAPLLGVYEQVFNHQAFTGRSGGMFGFEGLGCIYWHMVAKLLLAVQENYFVALELGTDEATCLQLGELYYRVRDGIGFNKTPAEYGAFPCDPYSHTPKHAGAQQPGMTGQVKEEILSRFGELGLHVNDGMVNFQPSLLRTCEFVSTPRQFRYLDVDGNWQELTVPASALAFTWCQVPIIYQLDDQNSPSLSITKRDGVERVMAQLMLPTEESAELFQRNGEIREIRLLVGTKHLFPTN
jgi:hypothetical protein